MNFFRLLGDLCHLYSILVLIYKMHARKTCAGVSLRTRALYMLVFLARYEDLFLYFVSVYNTLMKLLYLGSTGWIVWLMVGSPMYKDTWYRELDRFAVLPLVSVSAVLAIICTARYTFFEVSWTFSIILESVAILPQLHHLTLVPTLPALPLSHLVALGLYRFFYVVNWVFRLAFDSDATSSGGWDNTAFIFGVIQTLVWADFMWVWYNRKQIKLPGVSTSVEDGRGAVDGEGSAVDEGDMAKSLVLQNLFKAAVWADNKVLGGRARVHQQLSVSAYPDHQVRIERGAGGAYSDDVPPVNEPAAPQTSPPAPVTVPASATVPAPFSPPAGIKDPWKSGDASIKAQSATSKPTGSSTAETSTTAKTTKQDDFDVE